ncbi:hypothetical protein C8Q78DRAFT_1082010 [Trametes maxima]|nr:hypothetical protein C8Q78DRAFT_1082010 [Trametes maxima]
MAGPPPPPAGGTPSNPGLGDSFGVMLLSTIIAAAMYGLTVLQTLFYYEKFPKDSWMLKTTASLVAAVWILDTVTIVLDSHAIYYYLIVNFDNPSALLNQVWSVQVEILITFSAVVIVQLFFVMRIYQLRPYAWYIPLAMAIIAIASYALIIMIFSQVFHHTAWSDVQSSGVNNPLVANWVLGLVVDTSITIVLCWYLWSEKVYVRHKTHRVLNRIIIFSVNRGAIAAGTQLLSFLLKFVWPRKLVWLAFHNVLSKVYANSMLATLNSRVAFRSMMSGNDFDGTELTMPSIRENRRSGKPDGHNHQVATLQFASNPVRSSTLAESRSVGSIHSDRFSKDWGSNTRATTTISPEPMTPHADILESRSNRSTYEV